MGSLKAQSFELAWGGMHVHEAEVSENLQSLGDKVSGLM